MRNWRRRLHPAVPSSIAGYGTSLAQHPHHSSMLLATVSAGGSSAVILVMQGFGECLRESQAVFVDGTFLTVPAGVQGCQILTLHAAIESHAFHPVMALMENRRRPLYEAVLRQIWNAAGNPRPLHVVTDFEPALQGALESVTGVRVQGCLFHYVQALLRRARQSNIRVRRNSPGWRLVQLYGALALLPAARIASALLELPTIALAEGLPYSDDFHAYYNNQWMARVGPEAFSVHGSPHRTTNIAESYHAQLKRALGPNPNIWRFTDVAGELFSVCASRRAAQAAGNMRHRNRTRHYIRATVVGNNVRALDRGSITIREFLIACSRMMDVGVGVVVGDDEVPDAVEEVVVEQEPDRNAPAFAPALAPAIPSLAPTSAPAIAPASALVLAPAPSPAPTPAAHSVLEAAVILCGVCRDRVPRQVLIPCGHVLCSDCIQQLEREHYHQCPFCRAFVANTNTFYFN